MSNVTRRELDLRRGTEGPRHDPYSFTESTVYLNDDIITLHYGLAVWLKKNGKTIVSASFNVSEEEVSEAFEYLTGIDAGKFEEYYYRIHPYFEDPMGCPSMYI